MLAFLLLTTILYNRTEALGLSFDSLSPFIYVLNYIKTTVVFAFAKN